MDSQEKVKYLVGNASFMVIATSNANGKPWVSPVGFACDESYNLYWVSSREALHSQNISYSREVAISIVEKLPSGNFDGVYFDAKAEELTSLAEIEVGIQLFQEQRPQQLPQFVTKSIADVTGDAAWRMYKATPVAIYKRADSTLNGQAVTTREQIQL